MVRYFTGEQYYYIVYMSNTPKGMVGTSKYVQYTVVYAIGYFKAVSQILNFKFCMIKLVKNMTIKNIF